MFLPVCIPSEIGGHAEELPRAMLLGITDNSAEKFPVEFTRDIQEQYDFDNPVHDTNIQKYPEMQVEAT